MVYHAGNLLSILLLSVVSHSELVYERTSGERTHYVAEQPLLTFARAPRAPACTHARSSLTLVLLRALRKLKPEVSQLRARAPALPPPRTLPACRPTQRAHQPRVPRPDRAAYSARSRVEATRRPRDVAHRQHRHLRERGARRAVRVRDPRRRQHPLELRVQPRLRLRVLLSRA